MGEQYYNNLKRKASVRGIGSGEGLLKSPCIRGIEPAGSISHAVGYCMLTYVSFVPVHVARESEADVTGYNKKCQY